MTAGPDYIVPARSWAAIAETAASVRANLGFADKPYFPIMDILDRVLPRLVDDYVLIAGDDELMLGAEGLTHPEGEFIALHEEVMRDAWDGDGRARFTAAHEFGHWVMHTGLPMRRTAGGNDSEVEPYRRAEPQANEFAACLLMPAPLIKPLDTASVVMQRFGVSYQAAELRVRKLQRARRGWRA